VSVSRAEAWRAPGGYFSWRPADPDVAPVQIFHVEAGDADAPPLVLVHGFPTSSIGWFETVDRLAERFRVCALDFPGYEFSVLNALDPPDDQEPGAIEVTPGAPVLVDRSRERMPSAAEVLPAGEQPAGD
jgi:pimeloyl-ACP methyl ester carboxylesterase